VADDVQTGGMIALIPDSPGQFTVPGGDPTGVIHCTLVFLGDDVTDLDDATREELIERVARMATNLGPIEAQIMGPAIWNRDGGPDGKHKPSTNTTLTPTFAMQDANQYARDIGVSVLGTGRYPKQFEPWAPHICAGYELPETTLPKAKGTARFSTVRLALAGKDHDFPLTGWGDDQAGDMTPPSRYAGNGVMEMTSTETATPVVTEKDGELQLFFPCLAVEGKATADGRFIHPGALTTRALPISILAQTVNPGSDGGHAKAEIMGKLDEAWKIPGPEFISKQTGEPLPEGTFVWQGRGTADPESVGGKLAAKGYLTGNSVDLSELDWVEDVTYGEDGEETTQTAVSKGVIAATTLCAIPAFPDAYVEIDGSRPGMPAEELAAADTLEKLRALLESKGVATITAAAFSASELGDDCLSCAVEEFGKIPPQFLKNAKAKKADDEDDPKTKTKAKGKPDFLKKKLAELPPVAWFEDPKLDGPTPLQIDPDTGQIFGHIATWGTCHIGISRQCTPPPRSGTDYAYFMTGARFALDDEGARRTVAVGHLTMDTGHAELSANAADTVAHYDNTGTNAADVAAGEDTFGIWIAGAIDPELSERDRARLLAAAPSGDWRNYGGHLEMVAVLSVNTPGYPVTRARVASGVPMAMTAAGATRPAIAFGPGGIDYDELATRVAAKLGDLLGQWGRSPEAAPDKLGTEKSSLALELERGIALEELMRPFPVRS
jgi:hypothetical protein